MAEVEVPLLDSLDFESVCFGGGVSLFGVGVGSFDTACGAGFDSFLESGSEVVGCSFDAGCLGSEEAFSFSPPSVASPSSNRTKS